jgi:protein TonB
MPIFWTAHQIFKHSYGKTLRTALLLALFVHLCIFVLAPPFEFEPYKLKEPPKPVVVVNVDHPIIPKPPREVQNPDAKLVIAPGPTPSLPITSPPELRDLPPPPLRDPAGERFFAFDLAPVAVDLAVPVYPELARDAGIEGKVTVIVLIDEEGKVIDASVENSDVTPAMERAALAAARKSRFDPARQGTRPVKAQVAVPFFFRLH